jgi:predicted DNA-binding transcriptional regulator AlpA
MEAGSNDVPPARARSRPVHHISRRNPPHLDATAALSANDLSVVLNVSLSHIHALHRTARLPLPVRLGRSTRWRKSEIEAWLAAGCPCRAKWESIRKVSR